MKIINNLPFKNIYIAFILANIVKKTKNRLDKKAKITYSAICTLIILFFLLLLLPR